MGTQSQFVWMDGKLTPFENATVPFLNRTRLAGLGIFEGSR